MANVSHSTLSGAELHEPKGADSASNNAVYTSNGAGSGNWTVPFELITYTISDVSTAGSHWVFPGRAGSIQNIRTALHGAIATADAGLTFEVGGSLVVGGDITITQSGSAAGDVDSSTPSSNNSFSAAQPIEIITDGASSNAVAVTVTLEVQWS